MVCFFSFTYLVELFVEEQNLSLEDQGDVGVVLDVDGRVMCRVRDSKEYRAFITGPSGSKSKPKNKGKGKEKAPMPPPDDSDDADNVPNPPDITPVEARTLINIVSLTSAEEKLAAIPEEEVDFTDARAAAEWQDAHEMAAARTAELSWSEKALADAEGHEGVFKDEGYYRIWKVKQLERGTKRGRDEDDNDDHAQKKLKE